MLRAGWGEGPELEIGRPGYWLGLCLCPHSPHFFFKLIKKKMKGRESRVGDLCQQPLTYGGVLAEEGAVKMFLRGRPVPMLIPDELAPTYSLDTRSELPSCRLKLDWVYPFALFFLPLLTYPPHHHPPAAGRDKSPSGVELKLEGGALY